MSVNCNGNIVADSRNKLVKILSQGGQLLQKISGDGSFTFPFHCFQYDKHLIVSDSRRHCIKVFDRDGKLECWGRGSSINLVACLLTRQDT